MKYTELNYTELNSDAIEELKKRTEVCKPVWVWNESWIRTDALGVNCITAPPDSPMRAFRWTQLMDTTMIYAVPTFDTEKFLYVVSDTQPDWSPELRTFDQVLGSYADAIWWLGNHEWFHTLTLDKTKVTDFVYLVQATQPIYHPLQQKIAKLVLQGNKISESEPEPQQAPTTVMERIGKIRIGDPQPVSQSACPAPTRELKQHRYSNLIAQLAENPYQPLFRFNDDKGYWVQIDNPFLESNHYAIGEKPTEPPVPQMKMLKVKVGINSSFYTFELEVPSKASEKEISEAVNQAILSRIHCTYETSTHNVDMTKFSKSLQLSYTLNIPIQKSDAQDHVPNFQIFEDIQDQMTLVVIPPEYQYF